MQKICFDISGSDSYLSHMEDYTPPYSAEALLVMMKTRSHRFTLFHHVPVFTVAESDEVSAQIPGFHTRNLFLRDKKGRMFLVTLGHDTPVDLKKLSDFLGVGRFSFGSPTRLWTYLGVRPGSVTPLSILNDTVKQVQLILEKDMMEEQMVNFHPLDNSMTVGMTPQTLLDILEQHDVSPHILDLSQMAPDQDLLEQKEA
ncbi:MAG: prolyl-tRNA synthetase associated domain-containing protein [Alphaproteobacteria bacterium]|nr:prolyl-tRNA synthetase associated domain-containing protein [Alphaproteobacteria bacterium]